MREIISQNIPEEEEDTQRGRYLTFTLDKETYGIEICYVTEIIGIQPITAVPELPEYIRGIINLRGRIIPVMDIRRRFRKPTKEYNDRTCIIVIDIRDMSIGLIVDHVSEVLSIPETEMVAPPIVNSINNRYIKSIGKRQGEVKLILECEKLLSNDETDLLGNIKEG